MHRTHALARSVTRYAGFDVLVEVSYVKVATTAWPLDAQRTKRFAHNHPAPPCVGVISR